MASTHNADLALISTELTKPCKHIIRLLTVITFFAVMLITQAVASADSITLTINPTSLTSPAGGTVNFVGTITNNTGVDLNATDLFANFSGFDPDVITAVQLLGNPDFVLTSGSTSAFVNIFSVTLSPTAIAGNTYSLEVFLQDINNNLSNSITVSVNVGAAAIPEPATLLLLGTGLAGAAIARYKRRQRDRRL